MSSDPNIELYRTRFPIVEITNTETAGFSVRDFDMDKFCGFGKHCSIIIGSYHFSNPDYDIKHLEGKLIGGKVVKLHLINIPTFRINKRYLGTETKIGFGGIIKNGSYKKTLTHYAHLQLKEDPKNKEWLILGESVRVVVNMTYRDNTYMLNDRAFAFYVKHANRQQISVVYTPRPWQSKVDLMYSIDPETLPEGMYKKAQDMIEINKEIPGFLADVVVELEKFKKMKDGGDEDEEVEKERERQERLKNDQAITTREKQTDIVEEQNTRLYRARFPIVDLHFKQDHCLFTVFDFNESNFHAHSFLTSPIKQGSPLYKNPEYNIEHLDGKLIGKDAIHLTLMDIPPFRVKKQEIGGGFIVNVGGVISDFFGGARVTHYGVISLTQDPHDVDMLEMAKTTQMIVNLRSNKMSLNESKFVFYFYFNNTTTLMSRTFTPRSFRRNKDKILKEGCDKMTTESMYNNVMSAVLENKEDTAFLMHIDEKIEKHKATKRKASQLKYDEEEEQVNNNNQQQQQQIIENIFELPEMKQDFILDLNTKDDNLFIQSAFNDEYFKTFFSDF